MKKSIKFLKGIFTQNCSKGNYVILATLKGGKNFSQYPIKFNKATIEDELKRFFTKYPMSVYDLYFSPMPYSEPNRKLSSALSTKFLAQDIDEACHPDDLDPQPAYVWESSPKKYQGLWELDRYIEESEYTPLNKALAKHIGCDDCFDFPHVYRIPDTVNHKYKNKPAVRSAEVIDTLYKPKDLGKLVGLSKKAPAVRSKRSNVKSGNSGTIAQERTIYAKYNISQRVLDMLAMTDLEGEDRSSLVWSLENSLHEAGLEPNEIILLVKNSVFNKYKGRDDEDERLRTELEKIISGKVSIDKKDKSNDYDSKPLKLASYTDVMANENTFAGWLVKGFWGRRSHGIVAGMPKCFKSTLVHDLAISVASGKKFLGEFPVLESGSVIFIQNENADFLMKDRTHKIIHNRGLTGGIAELAKNKYKIEFPEDLPIHFLNQQGFSISNEDHRRTLEGMIKEIKPVLVIFDPLYLMFNGDLNSAQDLNPALNWLLSLKVEYSTSVMLIHHYNKGGQNAGKGGSRMAGSVFLYGWIESAWYLSRDERETEDDDEGTSIDGSADGVSAKPALVTMNREFRMAGAYPEIDIHLDMGEIGSDRYKVTTTLAGERGSSGKVPSLGDDILTFLTTRDKDVSRKEVAEALGIQRSIVREALAKLVEEKKVFKTEKGLFNCG